MIDEKAIRQRWEAVGGRLDERGRRLFAACEVRSAGWGGLAAVSRITGLARSTINRGANDLDAEPLPKRRVRRAGGGRRAVCKTDPGLVPALERLVAPATLGDPMRTYRKGIKVSKAEMKRLDITGDQFHPEWNDTIRPHQPAKSEQLLFAVSLPPRPYADLVTCCRGGSLAFRYVAKMKKPGADRAGQAVCGRKKVVLIKTIKYRLFALN